MIAHDIQCYVFHSVHVHVTCFDCIASLDWVNRVQYTHVIYKWLVNVFHSVLRTNCTPKPKMNEERKRTIRDHKVYLLMYSFIRILCKEHFCLFIVLSFNSRYYKGSSRSMRDTFHVYVYA